MAASERNKRILVSALALLAVAMLYRTFWGGPPASTPAARPVRTRAQTPESGGPSLKEAEDPSLRLELLAKVQAVEYQGPQRNIFQFHTPAPPPAAIPKPATNPLTTPAGAPPKPPAPPIPLKFYGFSSRPGQPAKKAFLADGEEIYIAAEGEMVKRRYRIIRIGVNTIEVEDTETKNRQTLPLEEGG